MPWRNFKRFLSKFIKQPLYAIRVAERRARAYFSYYAGEGKASFPEAITLFLTHRCNLRCKMCGQWGESGITKRMSTEYIKQELTFEELKSLIDGVSCFRPNMTLFGGEPLLYPDCIDLIKYIKKKRMHCIMITNGSLLKNFARSIVSSSLDELNISLDGPRDLHDEIRGIPGIYDRIKEGIKDVNRIKRERGLKRPLINLQCTITKYNYMRLEQLLTVAEDVGADSMTFHNLIFLGKGLIEKQRLYDKSLTFSSAEWEGFAFEPEIEPELLYSKMEQIMAKSYRFAVDFYPNFSRRGLEEYYKNSSYMPSEYRARCLSPWITAYIFPDGEIRPCLNFDYSYGNIRERRFAEIWNGENATKYRKALKKNNIFPVCVRCTELYRY